MSPEVPAVVRHRPLPKLIRTPLLQQAADVCRGTRTPIEIVDDYLTAIQLLEPAVHAYSHVATDDAREQALRLSAGLDTERPRSALHGMPVAVKDNIDVADMPTSAGSHLPGLGARAGGDSAVVRTLRHAGAVIIGKTRLPEFAVGASTPLTRNPWQVNHSAGGSSGGSAAAVAAGQCVAALGTDTGGSIRIPAALCGVAGLAPRRTQVELVGITPVSPRLDTCGPIARSIEDLIEVWAVLHPQRSPMNAQRHLRIGRVPNDLLGPADPYVQHTVDAAIDQLTALPDIDVVEVRLAFDDWHPHRRTPLLYDAASVHRSRGWYPHQRGHYSPRLRSFLDHGARLTNRDLQYALDTLRPMIIAIMRCLDVCDLIALPTAPITAPPVGTRDNGTPDQPATDRTLTRLCAPFNFCPVATLTMPAGFSPDGLPIGLQLVARDESTVLAGALRLEQHTRRITSSGPFPTRHIVRPGQLSTAKLAH